MANIKSQKKRNITNEKSRQRNRAIKSELKTAVRAAREAVAAGDATAAYAKGLYACRLLDKAVSKGVIHKNQAANRKSGVMAYVKPEAKKQEANGSKKAARKAEKAAAYKAAAEEKAKRVAEQQKLEAAAAERKAKEAAEAAAEAEAAEGEEAAE